MTMSEQTRGGAKPLTAATIMSCHPNVLHPYDTIHLAAEVVMKYRYRNLPVVDDESIFQGCFGIGSLLRMVLPHAAVMQNGLDHLQFLSDDLSQMNSRFCQHQQRPVSDFMERKVKTVSPDNPLIDTMLIVYREKSSLPVVEPHSGKLVGMISYWDIGQSIMAVRHGGAGGE
ncbi:CBS domain-containing protein [Ectothiorhodospiraceae bacterium BW-2]|nr:CBS domain-containing protein [Ectothiorhodospiraceae bacterium BW-2]